MEAFFFPWGWTILTCEESRLKYAAAKKEVLFWRWDRKYENLNFDKIGNGS